jgi:hypothetical protein
MVASSCADTPGPCVVVDAGARRSGKEDLVVVVVLERGRAVAGAAAAAAAAAAAEAAALASARPMSPLSMASIPGEEEDAAAVPPPALRAPGRADDEAEGRDGGSRAGSTAVVVAAAPAAAVEEEGEGALGSAGGSGRAVMGRARGWVPCWFRASSRSATSSKPLSAAFMRTRQPRAAASLTSARQVSWEDSASQRPSRKSEWRARVSATLRRRRSVMNPSRPGCVRTQERMMTVASRPWNPSTVESSTRRAYASPKARWKQRRSMATCER